MTFDNTTKKILAYIIIFPAVIFLVYAVVTYYVFLNYQRTNNKHILEANAKVISSIYKSFLITKVNSLNKLLDIKKSEDFKRFLKQIVTYDNTKVVIINKNSKIFFKHKNIPKDILKKIEKLKDNIFYEDNELIAFSSNKNRYKYKIIAFLEKRVYLEPLTIINAKLNESAKDLFINSLYFFILIWFITIAISLFIAYLVYKKLKFYEKTIKNHNEQIIFQSRNAMLGELLPMIAHQWRQPINKIASVLMRMRFELGKENPNINTLDNQCQTIESSVELMSNTIDDFRSFYRPKGKPEVTNLAMNIRKAIFFLDEILEKKSIKIQTNLENVESKIHGNEFLQVIINLIKNAADAVGENGTIYITLKEINNIVELKVEDDGIGIDEDKLDKIFEPHVSTKQSSMGLGLYMSKLIIETHFNGIIKAYNTNKGAGFLIRFPKKN